MKIKLHNISAFVIILAFISLTSDNYFHHHEGKIIDHEVCPICKIHQETTIAHLGQEAVRITLPELTRRYEIPKITISEFYYSKSNPDRAPPSAPHI